MPEAVPMRIIAHIQNDFTSKFGIPRQSGLVNSLKAEILFEPDYRDPAAVRGLEGYSHIWLLWQFSKALRDGWSPTVRPPRLGGNKRIGVFATRSPFRPNAIGLSCVRLDGIEIHPALGPVLHVSGADLMNGSPIYDIKPYLAYTDCHPDAAGGFTSEAEKKQLHVIFPEKLFSIIPNERQNSLLAVLAQDPRPAYQHTPLRVYGMEFAGFNIRFTVEGDDLTVVEATPLKTDKAR